MGEISEKEFRGYVEAKSKILMFKVQLIDQDRNAFPEKTGILGLNNYT